MSRYLLNLSFVLYKALCDKSVYMKLISLFTGLFFLLVNVPEWTRFESEKGGFSVLAPGEMIEKTQEVETEIGQLTYHIFFHKPDEDKTADNFLYMVSYCDYPDGSVHSDSTDLLADFFDATVESSVFSVNGELEDTRVRSGA